LAEVAGEVKVKSSSRGRVTGAPYDAIKMTENPKVSGSRLVSVDALRGAAALAVVLFHAAHQARFLGTEQTPRWLGTAVAAVIYFGYTGVYLFFVISGFCIHLRWAKAKAAGQSPSIDFFAFWKRRIRRLYPPYIVAMCFYLIVLAVEGNLQLTRFFGWDLGLHLLMLHNFNNHTAYSINNVFWTLAIEEQLYLAYFLLVPLRIRFGWAKTLCCCLGARFVWFALSFTLFRQFGVELPVTEAAATQWFVWALGALSIEAAVGLVQLPRWTRDLRLGLFILLLTASLSYVDRFSDRRNLLHDLFWLVVHPMWGMGFFIIINRAVAAERGWRAVGRFAPRAIAVFASVGIFSYSLYLTHELILTHLYKYLTVWLAWPRSTLLLFSLFILSAVSVVFAWAFFWIFEKPFISWASAAPSPVLREKQAEAGAA
jgi:peptidoglycan/LPS O-acetylase OafA/YrhL